MIKSTQCKKNGLECWKFHSSVVAFFLIINTLFTITSCKKLVDIPPAIGIIAEGNVYLNDESAIAAVTGIYTGLTQLNANIVQAKGFFGNAGFSMIMGLSSDEFELSSLVNNAQLSDLYHNSVDLSVGYVTNKWAFLFEYVYQCNSAIEGLNKSDAIDNLTPAIRLQLLGEAKFLRGFFYFYISNLYGGDVPLALTTDYKANALLSRSPKAKVYEQIISDLSDAENLLSEDYKAGNLLQTTIERVRPTKWAAKSLLARAYLYNEQHQLAEEKASQVISMVSTFNLLPSLNDVFLKNSKEAIWQLQPTVPLYNTQDGNFFVIPPTGPSGTNPVCLSDFMLLSFEAGDKRAISGNWIDSRIYNISSSQRDTVFYSYKYKKWNADPAISGVWPTPINNMSEYQMVIRLAELYLIRAEARAKLGNISGAKSDIDLIRSRAGLPRTTANDAISLQNAILHERQVELFAEGHRWFDLRRTGKMDEIMTIVTPIKSLGLNSWQSFQQYYPLSRTELNRAPSLTQTPGY